MRFLSGAWTPNIIWYLREGSRRFSELKEDVQGISAKVLTTRLKQLEDYGILIRTVIDSSPPTVEYELSPLGLRLIPAIQAIVEVGHDLRRLRRNVR